MRSRVSRILLQECDGAHLPTLAYKLCAWAASVGASAFPSVIRGDARHWAVSLVCYRMEGTVSSSLQPR